MELTLLLSSFMTPRYLGEAQGQEVKRTRLLRFASPNRPDLPLARMDHDRAEMAGLYADIAFVNQPIAA